MLQLFADNCNEKCVRFFFIVTHKNIVFCYPSLPQIHLWFQANVANTHISTEKKSYLRLNLLRNLSHATYGAEQSSLLRIYRAIIQSKCHYGTELYIPQPLRLFVKQFIQYIISLRTFPTTAHHALHNLSATLPPNLYQKLFLFFLRFSIRILTSYRTLFSFPKLEK